MKKLTLIFISISIILVGCNTNNDSDNEQEDVTTEEAVVSRFSISNEYYRSLTPFKVSESRGLISNNISNRIDIDNFEMGLQMRIATTEFPTNTYLFQEGQHLDRDTVSSWIRRNSENNPEGLNPVLPESGTTTERHQQSPFYLAHILEHNYLKEDSNGNYLIGGMVIGLAMNSVHYFNLSDEEGGFPREIVISEADMLKQGQNMAQEILTRLRNINGLEEIPITFAIYRQNPRGSLIPGNFVQRADVSEGDSSINQWQNIDEQYFLFPSAIADRDVTEDSNTFNKFRADVSNYFPNYVGLIGKGFYIENQLQRLNIEIPINFFSKTEVVGFTQYVASLVIQYFPHTNVVVSISSNAQQESLIIKEGNSSDPFVHIYN